MKKQKEILEKIIERIEFAKFKVKEGKKEYFNMLVELQLLRDWIREDIKEY